jgi:hypothetical protein
MELKDATLVILSESADFPGLAELAQSAYNQLVNDEQVDYRLLCDMIAETSGKGVLRAINQKPVPPRSTDTGTASAYP